MSRKAVYSALFNKLSTCADFKTVSERAKLWSDVPASKQPALFFRIRTQSPLERAGFPARWILRVDLYLYAAVTQANDNPAEVLNDLIDAVESALRPGICDEGRQTLGGLVEHCCISGDIKIDDGALDNQAVAVIPVEILTR